METFLDKIFDSVLFDSSDKTDLEHRIVELIDQLDQQSAVSKQIDTDKIQLQNVIVRLEQHIDVVNRRQKEVIEELDKTKREKHEFEGYFFFFKFLHIFFWCLYANFSVPEQVTKIVDDRSSEVQILQREKQVLQQRIVDIEQNSNSQIQQQKTKYQEEFDSILKEMVKKRNFYLVFFIFGQNFTSFLTVVNVV